jgi:hypothetical protein
MKPDVPLLNIPNAIPDAERLFRALLANLPWTRQTYRKTRKRRRKS